MAVLTSGQSSREGSVPAKGQQPLRPTVIALVVAEPRPECFDVIQLGALVRW